MEDIFAVVSYIIEMSMVDGITCKLTHTPNADIHEFE